MTVSSGGGAHFYVSITVDSFFMLHSVVHLLKLCSVSASETTELNKDEEEEEEEETQGGEAMKKERCEGQIKTKPGL